MVNWRIVLAITILPMLIGVVFIGNGLTGMVVYDVNTVKQICEADFECGQIEACCLFYQENAGVCDKKENCLAVYEVTKKEKEEGIANGLLPLLDQDKEQRIRNYTQIYYGLIVLTIICISLITYLGFEILFNKKEAIKN